MKRCERCDGEIPADAKPQARHCSQSCQKRAWAEKIIGECRDCGKGMSRRSVRVSLTGLCLDCFHAGQARAFRARAEIIADLWADGMSRREIAAELGWTDNYVSVEFDRIRRAFPGLLPYRYALTNPRAQAAA